MAEGMDRTNRTERTDLLWAGEELKEKRPPPRRVAGRREGGKDKAERRRERQRTRPNRPSRMPHRRSQTGNLKAEEEDEHGAQRRERGAGRKRKLSAVVSGSELGPTGPAACRTDEVKPES